MAKTRSSLKIGDQPSEQTLQEINSAAKRKPNLKAMPELSKKTLKEFIAMAKEKRTANILSKALKQPRLLRELAH